ncbi:carboxylate--amine ligase [Halobacteriales archaeon QS_3_64_16]|nr:MAG: carboxylate--amine ligase [Halobacteriales archaeon QS_3_64_16]
MESANEGEAVVLPANYSPSCYACLRSLASREVYTVVVSPYRNVPAFASQYCDEAVVVPSPQKNVLAYKEALLSLAERPDIRTILPVWEEDTYLLSKYRSEFESHVSVVVPPFEALRTIHDQMRLVETAMEAGVSTPKTWLLDGTAELDRELIVKSRYNLLVEEYVGPSVSAETELDTWRVSAADSGPDVEAIRTAMGHTPIAQEVIPGDIYCFRALYEEGEPVAVCLNREWRQNSYTGGVSVYRESISMPKLEKTGCALLNYLDWEGLVDVEFLQDPATDEFKLMDVNPRAWGSISCDIGAGADFPYYYWLVAGGIIPTDPGYETGFAVHSLFGEVQYLLSVLRGEDPTVERPRFRTALWEVLSSVYRQPQFDYLFVDDPGPFIRRALDVLPGVS